MTDIWFTTANIRSNPLQWQIWVRRRIAQAVKNAGFVILQEVDPARYHRAARRQAARKKMTAWNNNHEVPILAPSSLVVSAATSERISEGLRGVSPSRYLSEILTEYEGKKISIQNVHPPSKPRRGVDHAQWRIDHWNKNWAALQARCAQRHNQNIWVFVGGDTNKNKPQKPHPNAVNVSASGLDHLWVIPPAGHTVRVKSARRVGRTKAMDHPIVSAFVSLT